MMLPTIKSISGQISALFIDETAKKATIPIWVTSAQNDKDFADPGIEPRHRDWLKAIEFKPALGMWTLLPGDDGVAGVVLGAGDRQAGPFNPLLPGALPPVLPKGDYHLAQAPEEPGLAAIAWALGHYAFKRYQANGVKPDRRLRLPKGVSKAEAVNIASAVCFGRDLINIPANDLGPAELAEAAQGLAAEFDADFHVTAGEDLIAANFPLIHAVGRASARPPRLIDMRWGKKSAPKVTLIGKGMCFDTGGLNIKTGHGMALMKKDMGGAAAVLALAAMIMRARLPVRLRVLIPAAENAISGSAYRPGDIVRSRAGLNVEVGDTDAEGRLVLADALALADEEKPDHLFTFATLTGSARVALGPDLPPLYSTDTAFANALAETGRAVADPMWPMPLWQPYDQLLDGRTGDVCSIFPEPFAGSIMAALFLKRFVKAARTYTHLDIYGWVPRPQPGKPFGGEPQCARAVYDHLKRTYPSG
jgi:leucyl aminopeptidase